MHHLRININLPVQGGWGFNLTSSQIPNPAILWSSPLISSTYQGQNGEGLDFVSNEIGE